jgi:two-component system response regulator RegA
LASENRQLAVVELKIAGESGLKLISTLIGLHPDTRIVVLTGWSNDDRRRGDQARRLLPVQAGKRRRGGRCLLSPSRRRHRAGHESDVAEAPGVGAGCPGAARPNGNISEAARALSMHRRTLQRKLAKHPVRC